MFDRFIRLARAKKALREQRFLDALQQASDPLIEGDRRAEHIRRAATEQLVRRARARLSGGDVTAARAELKRLEQLTAGEVVGALAADVASAAAARDALQGEQGQVRKEFQRLFESGALVAAESLLATIGVAGDGLDLDAMRARIAARRREAAELVDAALRECAASPRCGIDGYLRALGTDRDLPRELRERACRELGRAVAGHVGQALAPPGGLAVALAEYAATVGRLPELVSEPAVAALAQRMLGVVAADLEASTSLSQAAGVAQAVYGASLAVGAPMADVVAALRAVEVPVEGRQTRLAALGLLREAAGAAGLPGLAELATRELDAAAQGEERLTAARALLEQGQLEAARGMFVAFLAEHPMHAGVQKELELVDQGLADLDRRLADVRLALRAGRLREACTSAMALVGSRRIAGEAQQILAEARGRMALVDKGLDEVRVALHGRAAATPQGVRHCLKRLEELAKVQVDHGELPQVIAAVGAELDALAQCEAVEDALRRAEISEVVEKLPQLLAARGLLLGVERLDAKLCHLGDGVVQLGERALADGRLAFTEQAAGLLVQLAPVRADFAARVREWRSAAEQRRAAAATAIAEARARLAERDLADAERLLEEAERHWRESAEVRAFAEQLRQLRRQARTLEQVAALAEEKDFLGAHQKLAEMPNVPPLLRTRVYDMKQDLARAQGLEGAFLLRVDEGGEQLVMRGETVTIGNVRQSRADLPVLANLAGRHASIRRSMSFHGGMQDAVVAEDGEVRVGGAVVPRHVLQSGDRVRLGSALGFVYDRPTGRSLSTRIVLQSGFQVAGTDRVLLMKDRGRDGRILLGPGRDVHVTVPSATGEVELFASGSGQMRVACAHGGTIDGAPFRGEHPVAAGQVVEAAGVSFVLLPWCPTA